MPYTTYQNTAIADFNEEVAEFDENNNTATDTYTVTEAVDGVFATITILPTGGTLTDQNAAPITVTGPIDGTSVTYTPDANTVSDSFTFTVTNAGTGLISDAAQVFINIVGVFVDECVKVGRLPGCLAGP